MKIPFSTDAFFGVFAAYNETVWPLQVVFFAIAVFSILSVFRKGRFSNIIAFSFLGFMWIWMGIVYHIVFFAAINRVAILFGVLFVIQGALFLYSGAYRQQVSLQLGRDVSAVVGVLLLVYSLVAYPLIGLLAGHVYPASPTFGLPCPTVIFTFGILTLSQYRVPWYLLLIPFLWSLIGFSAAVNLSVPQDFGLVIAGLIGTWIALFVKPRRTMAPGLAV